MESESLSIPLGYFSVAVQKKLLAQDPDTLARMLSIGLNVVESRSKPIETSASSKIGEIGEDYVYNILSPAYDVENVTKKAHSGDLLVSRLPNKIVETSLSEIKLGKILVEVKNYTYSVPNTEVNKFYDDLDSNQSITGGLFVSLCSKISNITKDFEMKFKHLGRKIPTIFITSSSPEIILLGIEILWCYIDLQSLDLEENERTRIKIDKIYKKILNLSELLNDIGRTRLMIESIRNNMNKSLQKLQNHVFSVEIKMSENIRNIKKIIGKVSVSDNIDTSGPVETTLSNLVDLIVDKNPEAQFSKKKVIRESFRTISEAFLGPDDWIEVHVGPKTVIQQIIDGKKTSSIILELLKTKTYMKINIAPCASGGKISIPYNVQYEDGWLKFLLDTEFVANVMSGLEGHLKMLKNKST